MLSNQYDKAVDVNDVESVPPIRWCWVYPKHGELVHTFGEFFLFYNEVFCEYAPEPLKRIYYNH